MPDPRQLLLNGGTDPQVDQYAQDFYSSLPDTSWLQARGGQGGTMTPQGYQMNPYARAQKAYEDDIIKGVNNLDITKPSFQEDAQNYFINHNDPQASEYPRVQMALKAALGSHTELKQLFQKRPQAAKTYADLINKGTSTSDAISQLRDQSARDDMNSKTALALVDAGIPRENLSDYQDKDGNYDPLAAHEAMFQSKQSNQFTKVPTNDKEMDALHKAETTLQQAKESPDANDPEYTNLKKSWMAKNPGKSWADADSYLTNQRVGSAQKQYQRLIQTLESSNRAVSPLDYESAGLPAPSHQFNAKGRARNVQPSTQAQTPTTTTQVPGGQPPMAMSQVPEDIASAPSINPEQLQAQQQQDAFQKMVGDTTAQYAGKEDALNKEFQGHVLNYYQGKYPNMKQYAGALAARDLENAISRPGSFAVDPEEYDDGTPNWEMGAKPTFLKDYAKQFLTERNIPTTGENVRQIQALANKRYNQDASQVTLPNGRTVSVQKGTPSKTS